MITHPLAILLNIDQGQIHRILAQGGDAENISVPRRLLTAWAADMRQAEMTLRAEMALRLRETLNGT